jgi:hypothetical protein
MVGVSQKSHIMGDSKIVPGTKVLIFIEGELIPNLQFIGWISSKDV